MIYLKRIGIDFDLVKYWPNFCYPIWQPHYGLTNAPPCFQRYINETLEVIRDLKCLTYLDDILVYGKTFDKQLKNIEAVLMKLKLKRINFESLKVWLL